MATNSLLCWFFFWVFWMGQPRPHLWAPAGFEDVLGGVAGVLLPGVVEQPAGFDGLLFQSLVFINHVLSPLRGSQGLDQELLATGLKIATEKKKKKLGWNMRFWVKAAFIPSMQSLGIFLQPETLQEQKLIN